MDNSRSAGQLDNELQRSDESLRLAVTGARVGTWHWNLRTGELIWSDLCYATFGQPIGSELSYERFLTMVHPDDRQRVQAAVRHCLETGTEYDIEFRTVWPDDSLHWTSAKGLVFCDALGLALRMEGIVLDITDQKNAERALGESEERYRMLTEGMPHLLWQLSPTGALVYANRGWQEYFGRTAIELFQWGEVEPAGIAAPTRGRGELVLLVEDEVGVREVMQTILEAHGYRLLAAADGNEALRCWEERAAEVDLLVSDVVMPHGLGGCELATKLQTDRPELKVILCSGYSAANITEAMKAIDHSMFLQKPYRPDQLLELVRRLLDAN